MKTIIILLTLFWSSLLHISCKNDIQNEPIKGNVEFKLVHSFDTLNHTFRIEKSSVVLADSVLVDYLDILSYDSKKYTFVLNDKAKKEIHKLKHSVHGLAFAVVVNDEIIYTGYFWPTTSSMTCDWITIDPIHLDINSEMIVRVGYPGLSQDWNIPDNRNDKKIIDIFERDGKLIR